MRPDKLKNIIRHPITAYYVQKAKRIHRKKNPRCALCNCKASFWGRGLDVHHFLPVHAKPERAVDPTNLITLCRTCHLYVGHCGNFKTWNANLRATIKGIQMVYQELVRFCRKSGPQTTASWSWSERGLHS